MTEQETIEILTFCKSIWPEHYLDMSRGDGFKLIKQWHSVFEDVPRQRVLTTVYTLSSLPSPPSVNEILEKIDKSTGGIDWKHLKEVYTKHGYYWPERYEQKLREVETCIS